MMTAVWQHCNQLIQQSTKSLSLNVSRQNVHISTRRAYLLSFCHWMIIFSFIEIKNNYDKINDHIFISQLEKDIIVIAIKHCFDATYVRSLYGYERKERKKNQKKNLSNLF